MRSLTLRTLAPATRLSASVITSAWSASEASHVTSTTSRSAWDSVTSSAVTDPPAPVTAATRSPVARADEGTSIRTVIE